MAPFVMRLNTSLAQMPVVDNTLTPLSQAHVQAPKLFEDFSPNHKLCLFPDTTRSSQEQSDHFTAAA